MSLTRRKCERSKWNGTSLIQHHPEHSPPVHLSALLIWHRLNDAEIWCNSVYDS